MAFKRFKTSSFPNIAAASKIEGDWVVPVRAARRGMATFPSLPSAWVLAIILHNKVISGAVKVVGESSSSVIWVWRRWRRGRPSSISFWAFSSYSKGVVLW